MANLNGMWLGTYWQEGIPTRFEATLLHSGSTLTGRVLDDSYLGEAEIKGEVAGCRIQFTKRYLMTSPTLVTYTGTVSEDANFMRGRWTIGRSHAGWWEAHRSSNELMTSLKNRMARQVTPAIGK